MTQGVHCMSNRIPHAQPAIDADGNHAAALRRLDHLARVMDAQFAIPGTSWRFGLDSLIGLIPGAGDFAGAAISAWIVAEALRMGVPKSAVARMSVNLLIDFVIGSIPIVGDIFDVAFKANRRNVRILQNALRQRTVIASSADVDAGPARPASSVGRGGAA